MTDLILQHYERQDQKLTLCCGQLGAYESLLNYAIAGLRGKTANKGEDLANFLEERQRELLDEQNSKIFERKYEIA